MSSGASRPGPAPPLLQPETAPDGDFREGTAPSGVPGRPSAQALLVGLGLLICGIICVGTLILVTALYQESYAEHSREVRNLATSLAEQTDRALQSLDMVQRSIEEQVADAGIATPQEFAAFMGRRPIHRQIREKMSGLPQVDALSVIGSDGKPLISSRRWPAPDIDVSERDYFIALSSMRGPPTFLGEPVVSRTTGRITIFLARRIAAADGTFLGLVLGAMEQGSFERSLATIELAPAGLIALVRDDGAMLARVPGSAARASPDAAERAAIARALFAREDGDDIVPAGILDENERVVAVRKLAHFPLAVVISDSVDWLEAQAWTEMLPIIAAAALVCGLIGLVIFVVIRQLDGERAFTAREQQRARHDALTGLPNRLFFSERLAARLVHAGEGPLALLYLDLDYFKTVNDTLGHDMGDALLREVAGRLVATVTPQDFVARLGGDEFAVICRQANGDRDASTTAHAIIDALRTPFILDHHQVLTGCSVGIALSPRDGSDVASLLKCADLALYEAKNDGRGDARLFEPHMGATARARRDIELDLHGAWEQDQFRIAYQPIFEAASGRLAGFEALLRWHHPVRGEVPPEQFIPAVEESGLILKVGGWILEESCRAAAAWPQHLFISVNVSPAQFRGGGTQQQVRAALAASGLDPSRLELEITESLLLKADAPVRALLDQFRSEGIILALDDFGTGYSSLRYLQVLNISRLKIDQSFIRRVTQEPHTQAIVKAILSLAAALQLKTTAEGIETEAQLDFLKREGCTNLQGFLLGPPMPAEAAGSLARAATP
ncbi:putative bifunctional diguanylate cyclase/phosphodiesterase [Xanthobacter sediminis]